MTTFERWRKGIFGAMFAILALALFDYLFPKPPVVDRYELYFMAGFAFLMGWLGGSAKERKSNRIHLTS
jgi:hypothetical protein